MPQIGWFELLIIVVISILVIGPKDFPIVLKKLGSWIASIKNFFTNVQSNIEEVTNLEENNQEKIENKNKVEKKDE
ncbi:MAG: twin-arginine translocase subunit TatB [Pelagibacterales bacterium MED-G40]|nr:MAG: twin-arginine translocase subunit TatB [Pelagibacterales bacterium MED-G40]|tara:strand:+ start:12380 stop:12607 length:228 start_codon:yes stop_codon:yes gene_type:complete